MNTTTCLEPIEQTNVSIGILFVFLHRAYIDRIELPQE